MRLLPSLLPLFMIFSTAGASAATLTVGAGGTYATINAAWAKANAGDVIEVAGDATYNGSHKLSGKDGAPGKPITVRGKLVNGKRPKLTGFGPGEWDNMVVWLNASHLVFEGFEIVGKGDPNAKDYCLLHMADDVTVRDVVVHDCLHQAGLVGNDDGSGSLTLEYSEFYHNGSGLYSHQIYMATDQSAFPRSTFRMQHCYVHDGLGGNNVKSRAERNEIYSNWIEGATYHELDLIGPDTGGSANRCDSDVVGNVLIKTSEYRIARVGDDGSGASKGRFRFVGNTMVLASSTQVAIGLQGAVDSFEMFDNVIVGSSAKLYRHDEPSGTPALAGGANWVSSGISALPTEWTGTIQGADPGFVDAAKGDYRPTASSPLVGKAVSTTAATGAHAFPNPLALPAFYPPNRKLLSVGSAVARASVKSIGAWEPDSAAPADPIPVGPGPSTGTTDTSDESGCGCRTSRGGSAGWLAGLGFVLLALERRKARGAVNR